MTFFALAIFAVGGLNWPGLNLPGEPTFCMAAYPSLCAGEAGGRVALVSEGAPSAPGFAVLDGEPREGCGLLVAAPSSVQAPGWQYHDQSLRYGENAEWCLGTTDPWPAIGDELELQECHEGDSGQRWIVRGPQLSQPSCEFQWVRAFQLLSGFSPPSPATQRHPPR